MSQEESRSIQVFVFPLDDCVFFPTTAFPLNIFEPRYLKMLEDAMANQIPIAIAPRSPLDNDSENMVCGAGYAELIEKRKNGTLLVSLRGLGKVRLERVLEEDPYIVSEATLLPENHDYPEASHPAFEYLEFRLHQWIDQNVKDETQRKQVLGTLESPIKVVEYLAILFVREPTLQQKLLELQSLEEKIRMLQFLI
jgi:uncharacterized protein